MSGSSGGHEAADAQMSSGHAHADVCVVQCILR